MIGTYARIMDKAMINRNVADGEDQTNHDAKGEVKMVEHQAQLFCRISVLQVRSCQLAGKFCRTDN